MDDDRAGGFPYVFGDEAEVCAGAGSAFGEVGLVIELMGDIGVIGHLAGVRGGGFGENAVEAKRRKSLTGAGLVRSGEKILFGDSKVVFRSKDALGGERRRCRP